ncbi:hypothetical protein Tco_0018111 [Tanacetum coccineum]
MTPPFHFTTTSTTTIPPFRTSLPPSSTFFPLDQSLWIEAKYGKIWYDEDIHDLKSVETEFSAIAFNDGVSSEKTLSCEPTVSSLNDEIDFRISFDDSDDEDYTVNMPSFPSPEPTVNFSTEPVVIPQHIDEFNLKDETSLSECDKEEQNVLYFNDVFPFNVIYPDDSKLDKNNDDDKINIKQPLGNNVINTDVGAYAHGSNKILETNSSGSSLDKETFNVNTLRSNNILRYEGLQYTYADIVDFETRLARIYKREVHKVQVFDFEGLPDLMVEGLSARMLMEHRDAQGFFSTFRFGEAVTDLDTAGALQFQLRGARRRLSWRNFILAFGLHTTKEMKTVGFGAYWVENARQISDKGDLRDYWIGISFAEDFLGTSPSYTSIRDSILRLCHRFIACSIAGRSQAPKKVTVTNLFYLRGMEVGSVNVPYLLARYLRLFAAGRKSEALISGVIALALSVIDMAELVRLQIYIEVDDIWAWVAMGPERQPDAAVGAPRVAQDAPVMDAGGQADPAPALAEQREVIGAMAKDFSRFTVWAASGIAQLLDSARVTYTPYSETRIPYQRRVRQRTGETSTSPAQ